MPTENRIDCPALHKRSASYPYGDRVPRTVRMLVTATADRIPGVELSHYPEAKAGQTYRVWTNSHGAVVAVMEDGNRLGLRPAEFEVASWHHLTAEPAPQPHTEPIAWMVGTSFWWTKEEAERDAAATGLPIVGLGPMTDTAEAERLIAANTEFARRHLEGLAEVERLRAHLAEALRVASQAHLALIGYLPAHRNAVTTAAIEACAALSASAERRAPIAWHVGGNGYDRICFEMPAELPGHPCIQPIHDQRQLIDLLKRYDLRDEDVPPDERVHGISGTSFQRLNALANQGE